MFIHQNILISSSNHYHEFCSDLLATDVTQVIKIGEKAKKEINESSLMRRSKYRSNLKERQWCLCQYRVCITHCFSPARQLCQASYSAGFQLYLCGCCSPDKRHRTIIEGAIFINRLPDHWFGCRAIIVAMSPLILSFLVSFHMLWLRLYSFLFSGLVRHVILHTGLLFTQIQAKFNSGML